MVSTQYVAPHGPKDQNRPQQLIIHHHYNQKEVERSYGERRSEETINEGAQGTPEADVTENSPSTVKRVHLDGDDEEEKENWDVALGAKLTGLVFGKRANGVEQVAIKYLVGMHLDPRLVNGFLTATDIEDEEEQEHQEMPPAADSLCFAQSSASRSSRSTRTRSSKKDSYSSSSSNGSLKPEMLAAMRHEYEQIFDKFKGESWTLPSGQRLDDLVRPFVLSLTAESLMHSSVITNIDTAVNLVEKQADKDELLRVLGDNEDDERAWVLSDAEQAFIKIYDKSPAEVNCLISIGYTGVLAEGKGLTEPADAAFCDEVHSLVDHLRIIYKRNLYGLPEKQMETWYRENHWSILNDVFNIPEAIRLAIMEAANVENGSQGTKAMTDTVKQGKMMKDCFDLIRRNSRTDVLHMLTIYGMRISAGTISFYCLRLRQGRFFQFSSEGSVAFPALWRSNGASHQSS
ncbi:MAG: hypothetical protein J3Q66DRAFT_401773 [Benniella sp.]|nr:MAG: hypothetical protein J3Q66DRAFT_401773 [Benniella sp.]